MPNRHFLRSDIFTMAMGYYFYFRLFLLMNQIVKLNIVIFFSLLDEEGDSYA